MGAAETVEITPAQEYAQRIGPLLGEASRAYGSQPPGSPARVASDEVNRLVLEYSKTGAKMPALAAELGGGISLSGLRRRVRLARATEASGEGGNALGRVKRPRGTTDPQRVQEAAARVAEARERGGRAYGQAVREAYDDGVALQPIADTLGLSYFALWSAKRSAY